MTPLDVGLLLLGLTAGLSLAAHGAQKGLAWFGGSGMRGWTARVSGMGFRPAGLFAWASMLAELLGGIGLALGIGTTLAAGIVIAQLIVVIFHIHWRNGYWETNRGVEYPVLLAVVVVFLGIVGRGVLSVDGLLASPLLAAYGGLVPAHAVVPPLAGRIALLLAGAVAGSVALAVPRAAEARRQARAARELRNQQGDIPQ